MIVIVSMKSTNEQAQQPNSSPDNSQNRPSELEYLTVGDLRHNLDKLYSYNAFRQLNFCRELGGERSNLPSGSVHELDSLILTYVKYMGFRDGYIFAKSTRNTGNLVQPITIGNLLNALRGFFERVDHNFPAKVMVIEENNAVFHKILNKPGENNEFYVEYICRRDYSIPLQMDLEGRYLFPA